MLTYNDNYYSDDGGNGVNTNTISSHYYIISAIYNDKHIQVSQLFTIFRNTKLLTKYTLLKEYTNNYNLQNITNYTDSNSIGKTPVNDISQIINTTAPSIRIQCIKNTPL